MFSRQRQNLSRQKSSGGGALKEPEAKAINPAVKHIPITIVDSSQPVTSSDVKRNREVQGSHDSKTQDLSMHSLRSFSRDDTLENTQYDKTRNTRDDTLGNAQHNKADSTQSSNLLSPNHSDFFSPSHSDQRGGIQDLHASKTQDLSMHSLSSFSRDDILGNTQHHKLEKAQPDIIKRPLNPKANNNFSNFYSKSNSNFNSKSNNQINSNNNQQYRFAQPKPTNLSFRIKSFLTSNHFKYLSLSLLSLAFVFSLILLQKPSQAEQTGSSPNNNPTKSRLKTLYDDLLTLNYGTDTNTPSWGTFWNRIVTAAKWTPTGTVQPNQVCQGSTFYSDSRTKQTGTRDCIVNLGENTRGGDIYITGTGFTASTIAQVDGTNCQSQKLISATKLRCTIPPKNNGTYNIKVTNGNLVYNYILTYNNDNKGNMQDFRSQQCNDLKRGQAIVLTDSRNNQTYRIKKMADDKCWMIDNLRYANSSWTQPATNQSMTQNGSDSSGTNYNAWRYKDPGSSTNGCSPGSSANCYGYLYNWYTATYGTGTSSISTRGQNVTGNICPNTTDSGSTTATANGWKLPSGGSNSSASTSDYVILNTAMKDDTSSNNFTSGSYSSTNNQTYYSSWQPTGSFQGNFSGYYYSSLLKQGNNGYYWSSTAHSYGNTHILYFDSDYVSPGSNYGDRVVGFAVRCLVE